MAVVVNGIVDAMYINNPIKVTASENTTDSTVIRYLVRVSNISTPQIQTVTLYPDASGTIEFDLSVILKAMFKVPKHNEGIGGNENAGREVFSIRVTSYYTIPDDEVIYTSVTNINNKVFFRGGIRGNNMNVSAVFAYSLRSSEKLPLWPGYPVWDYQMLSGYNVGQLLPSTASNIERMKVKGCKSVYVKFFNSKGAYSFWLFEASKENDTTANEGYSNTLNGITDYGNTVDLSLEYYSKVPERYIEVIKDLIESPEIYIYNPSAPNVYERIVNAGNTITDDVHNKVSEVKVKFERVSNYNPSLIW